ncbi:uncharacterized protein PAN0_001d0463 [Moesziomyces antarcticus]|uniref:uncharacterized protein n=1 Tax=Pseudozyma antarctica TaxID=84753 RepID=UPI000719651C|nr:uncharacterized protein PAN0_001d0463 [Moesziomyces antarcticus]GAK62264.1 hypothetical protein PAN0_001d0463 [Moesziomyces antarcticus]
MLRRAWPGAPLKKGRSPSLGSALPSQISIPSGYQFILGPAPTPHPRPQPRLPLSSWAELCGLQRLAPSSTASHASHGPWPRSIIVALATDRVRSDRKTHGASAIADEDDAGN